MRRILKQLESGRSVFLCFPEGQPRTAFKRSLLTVLRDDDSEESVIRLLAGEGLEKLVDEKEVILSFPNPVDGQWNWELNPDKPDDLRFLLDIQEEVKSEKPPVMDPHAPPGRSAHLHAMLERMRQSWHPMDDTRYIAGFGTGASMACTVAALAPQLAAGIYAEGGKLAASVVAQSTWAPMAAFLSGCPEETLCYFCKANGALKVDEYHGFTRWENDRNPNQIVFSGEGPATVAQAYECLFSHVRRPNTGRYGDLERRLVPEKDFCDFELHLDETILPDGLPHTWFTCVPESIKANPEHKVPLLMFFHGATDSPAEAAEMCKFHEIGRRDGFITVYPWGTNKLTWNSDMTPGSEDDVGFSMALIDYMIENYPVDASRIYLSGFSNGAAQAQVVALCHPDRVAAICPIDSNWPGDRSGESEVDWHDVIPMRRAMEIKEETGVDYRIPNWYTYGNREPSYPVFRKCTQQHQYDFWKMYNNVTVKPTPEMGNPHPCGCGVPGDEYRRLAPSAEHPHHLYDVNSYRSNDPGSPMLYHYVVMLDKGHDVAQKDPELGWQFVRQFRREKDGSLGRVQ